MRELILEGKELIEIRGILLKEYPEAASDLAKSEIRLRKKILINKERERMARR